MKEVWSEPQKGVTTALNFPERIPPPTDSSGPRIWESKHYKAVLRLIAANPYHAVRSSEVHAALEQEGIKTENTTADQVLLSMMEYNVVSLRPYSKMAKDIPREAFFKKVGSKEKEDSVVTMPSPAHLAAVLEELELELEEQREESNRAHSAKGEGHANS